MNEEKVYRIISLLSEFSMIVGMHDFVDIFGSDVGSHLWRKFTRQCQSNTLVFWEMLSHENRLKLVNNFMLSAEECDITINP